MVMEDVLRYGSIKEGEIYRREALEIYAEKYRCMLIEDGASILAYDPSDDYMILQIIQGAGSNFLLGKTVVANKFFEQAIIIKKV